MKKTDLNDTQFWDEKRSTAYPWYTKPSLEYLETLDLKDSVILEYGGGWSTIWWSKVAKNILTIEANKEWFEKISPEMPDNVDMILREVNEGDQNKVDFYTFVPDIDFNIIVVDGILRNECLQHAIKLLSIKGGIIIADNWQQDFVWLSPAAEDLMKPYERKIFVQPNHTNHEGNPWKTAIFTIPKL